MASTPTDVVCLPGRIMGLHPDVIVQVGYNHYLADYAEDGSLLRESARAVVQQFNAICASFSDDSREGIYCLAMRTAVTTLARGIARRKKTLEQDLALAAAQYDEMCRRFAASQKRAVLGKGGVRLLMLGGFVFAFVNAIFSMPTLQTKTAGVHAQYASIATAVGITLIGAYFRDWYLARQSSQAFSHYQMLRHIAQRTYEQGVTQEYGLAAEMADRAWQQLTGQQAALTNSFRNLLLGLLNSQHSSSGDNGVSPQKVVTKELQSEQWLRWQAVHAFFRRATRQP